MGLLLFGLLLVVLIILKHLILWIMGVIAKFLPDESKREDNR